MDSEKFEPINEQKTKGNKSKIMIIAIIAIILVLVLAVVAIAGNSNAEAIFKKQIDKILTYETADKYDTMKGSLDLEMKIEGEEADSISEITNLINDTKFSFNVETDSKTQTQIWGIQLNKAEDELINAKAKLDTESKKAYLDLGQFFNKKIEVDMADILDESDLEDEEPLNFMQFLTAKKAMSILRKEVKAELKSEYFSTEKTTIDNENVTKNIFKVSGKQFEEILGNVCTNLSNNQDFLDCFENENEVKSSLDEFKAELDEIEFSYDMQMEIDLYTKGIFKNINRVDIAMTEDGETIVAQITKASDEEYAYQLLENDEKVTEGTIKIHKADTKTEIEVVAEAEGIKATTKFSLNTVYNEPLTDFDTTNAVKAEELTTTDMMALYGNFMGSKLYEIVEEMSLTGSNGILERTDNENENIEQESAKEQTELLIEDLKMQYYEEKYTNSEGNIGEIDEYIEAQLNDSEQTTSYGNYEITINNKKIEVKKNKKLIVAGILENGKITWDNASESNSKTSKSVQSTADNVVKTYDGDTIKFSIPAGFEKYSSDSDSYKLFEKELGDNSIGVDVTIEYSTLEEYLNEVKETVKYYQEEEEYKNVQISDVQEIDVNGNKFSKVVISYEYGFSEEDSEKYEDTYIAYEINSDYLYTVEIENSNLINEAELQQFLTIQKAG